ncbi:MAG TPA: hypothetical protein VMJ35_11225 [Dongiaceae bacterium]|nr:hypothetical protein [Dongiaceae bacterium]
MRTLLTQNTKTIVLFDPYITKPTGADQSGEKHTTARKDSERLSAEFARNNRAFAALTDMPR